MAQPITGRISSSAFAVLFWRAPSSTRRSGATRWLRSSTIKSLSSSTAAAATTTTTQNAASRHSPAAAPNTQQQWQQSACFFPQSLTLTWRRFATSSDDGNIGNNSGKPKEQNEDNSTWLGTIKSNVQQKTSVEVWDDGSCWTPFLDEVALWLRDVAERSNNEIVSTVAGLVNCAVKNGNDLIDLAGSPPTMEKLCTFLEAKGIPIAIGAKLYKKYVTLPQQNGKYHYITTVLDLPDGHV